MKITMFVIFFLLLGVFFIISEQGIKLDSKESFNTLFNYYIPWVSGLFDNVKTVTGYVVNMEWLPD